MISVFWKKTRGEDASGSGGAWISRIIMLLDGKVWRRSAVASPIPEEPPVMSVVLAVGDVREEREMLNASVAILNCIVGRRRKTWWNVVSWFVIYRLTVMREQSQGCKPRTMLVRGIWTGACNPTTLTLFGSALQTRLPTRLRFYHSFYHMSWW